MTDPTPAPPDWLDEFTIPETSSGAVLALDFDEQGIWAARLDRDRTVEAVVTEPRITPPVLDVRVATYLRDSESVVGVETEAGFAELLALCPQAREKLHDRDSALLLGREHLRLVTVSLDTVMAATVPEVNRAHGMIVELAGREPVAAVFLGPGTDDWPGLWEALSDRGYTLLLPEDQFPETFAGDEAGTGVLESVSSGPMSLAWAAAEDPVDEIAAADSDHPHPDAVRRRATKHIVVAAAITLVAVGGVGIALVTRGDGDQPSSATAARVESAESAAAATQSQDSAATVAVADSDEVRAARVPMQRYRPPAST
ncbi:MAG: hypothetical protein WAW85_06625, partial [Gordonia sp. (in: high G+C Gram-positive bacteria)]|uniref:hypothetical protein n=1 Tax=Gordonia sp. (in: high G+C Gram-positive bacteria) TaxID=84139 RepID=UPI003BB6873F